VDLTTTAAAPDSSSLGEIVWAKQDGIWWPAEAIDPFHPPQGFVLQAQHILALPPHERSSSIPPHLLTTTTGARAGAGFPGAAAEEEDPQEDAGGAAEAAEGGAGAGGRKVLLLWFGPKAPEWQPSDQLKPFVAHRKQLIGECDGGWDSKQY
jgi:hypothetical protein